MNWDAIGAIAELLAAIGVIGSLVFVGLQVKKSNAEARAATMQATTDSEIMMVATFARYADVWDKVNTGESLQGDIEIRRGSILFNLLMVDYENRFHQFESGKLDVRSWNNRLAMLDEVVKLPIFKFWRNSLGGKSRGADFLDLIDEVAKKIDEK
ncbi:MAG: hypothetical protein ACR2QR_10115 [Woeseiaceae bacterium]